MFRPIDRSVRSLSFSVLSVVCWWGSVAVLFRLFLFPERDGSLLLLPSVGGDACVYICE